MQIVPMTVSLENPLYYAGELYIGNELVTEANITTATKISAYAFVYCRSLTSIELPSGLTSIGSSAFSGCSSLRSIEIPAGVTRIGQDAFYKCSSLTSIEIPVGVTSIGFESFYSCSSLTSVYYTGSAEDWDKIDIKHGNGDLTSATVYYYRESDPFEGENAVTSGNYWHYVDGVPTVWTSTKE